MRTLTLAPEVLETLAQLKTSRAGSVAFGGAVTMFGGCIPDPFEIARLTITGFGVIFTMLTLLDHFIEKQAHWAWHQAYLQVYIARNLPSEPPAIKGGSPQPQDGGETPAPEFLQALFQYTYTHNNQVPSVRDLTAMVAGYNETRTQAMLTRLVTWGAIVGRVGRGASGTIHADWTHVKARAEMMRERPDYAPPPLRQ